MGCWSWEPANASIYGLQFHDSILTQRHMVKLGAPSMVSAVSVTVEFATAYSAIML